MVQVTNHVAYEELETTLPTARQSHTISSPKGMQTIKERINYCTIRLYYIRGVTADMPD
ncbi:hypothetical protein ACTXT7_004905 [Hymenolepis weldensis]